MNNVLTAAVAVGALACSISAPADARIIGTGMTRPLSATHLQLVNRTPLTNRNAPHSRHFSRMGPTTWAATSTQGINLVNATFLGATDPNQTVHISVALQLHSVQQLNQLVASGQEVDPATFAATYSPSSSDVALVTSYLSSQGFSNVSVEPNNLLVQADGSAAAVNTAFNTSLGNFVQNGQQVFANTTPAMVPSSLSGVVVSVLGLNNAIRMATPSVTSCQLGGQLPNGSPCVRFYDPATFNVVYDAGSTPPATAANIAIMAEGTTTGGVADWRNNETQFNMPQLPIQTVQVGLQSPDTAGNGEWTLDLTYSQAMAGGSLHRVYIYQTTSLTDQDIALEYNKWVTQRYAKIGNSSFGGCEYGPYLDGSMVAMDMILLQGASQGQTMFASTGDSGSFCSVGVPNGIPAGAPLTEYPASSPYVVAVGGTDLFSHTDGTYQGESSWEAGGGGNSQFEYSPYWEAGVQPVQSQGVNMRGLPDIAADASLETGALLYTSSSAPNGSCTPCITGGTSLSSPMNAGVWARLQSAHGNKLSFAPPKYYNVYRNSSAGANVAGPPPTRPVGPYHDILSGSNVLYSALPGYDYTTGMGSIDITLMNGVIGTAIAMSRIHHL